MLSKEETQAFAEKFPHRAVPTSEYNYEELAEIYSSARTDYIVPMPMNGKRMQEYVESYDIDLDASIVAVDPEDDGVNGICMLGVRDDRTWITRLGVIPERRRRKSGEFLMRAEIDKTLDIGRKIVQLEVIKGNEPAHRLFKKLGFEETRELLVIRRPPGPLKPEQTRELAFAPIEDDVIWHLLEHREPGAAWTEETASLQAAGNIHGLHVQIPSGEDGWVIYQRKAFQMGHFVFSPDVSDKMIAGLIAAVHQQNPMQDTKIENVPSDHRTWPIFQQFGYVIAFERVEMFLHM